MKKGFDVEAYKQEVLKRELAVDLEPHLLLIAEKQAKSSHEGWRKSKAAKGYVYGSKVNDDPKKGQLTSPLMVEFEKLSDEDKRSNMANAVAVLQILKKNGCKFVDFRTMIIYPIAREIHDEWSREKFMNGWTWGPVTDKDRKIHRDLRPFNDLLLDPELRGDIEFDITTAKEILCDMIQKWDVFPIISDLSKFAEAVAKA